MFQFLLSMHAYLEAFGKTCDDGSGEKTMAELMCNRISSTCEGHLRWLLESAQTGSVFSANYWATGHEIPYSHSLKALSASSLTDTPFQIIKVADYVKTFKGYPISSKVQFQEQFTAIAKTWKAGLTEQNRRRYFAFPRPGTQKYRLSDHLWIWQALQSTMQLGIGDELETKETNKAKQREKKLNTRALLTTKSIPAELQGEVLKRFTTENTASRKRMIAVSRTVAETRFLFHSRDSALFYPTFQAFFNKGTALWNATIESQKFHDENDDSDWDNPLRYAVALMMASRSLQINHKSAEVMFTEARKVLLASSSPNGLFPGQINNVTKEPELFHDYNWRDFYWHVSFEVPYILLLYGSEPPPTSEQLTDKAPNPAPVPPVLSHTSADGVVREHQMIALGQKQESQNIEMKKSMPFNDLIDQQSIVEMSDEWLYPYPDFLDFEPDFPDDFKTEPDATTRGWIVDVTKSSQYKKIKTASKAVLYPERDIEALDMEKIAERLKAKREAIHSKKRLIWLSSFSPGIRNLYIGSVSPSETSYVETFFWRAVNREEHFFDEVTATSNIWITELHLSFYQLVDEDIEKTELKFLGNKGSLKKVSIGFLFIGDFLDRYWTCRVLEMEHEHDPAHSARLRLSTTELTDLQTFCRSKNITQLLSFSDSNRRPWRQRKVLELLLLDQFLEMILKQYEHMLWQISGHLAGLLGKDVRVIDRNLLEVSNALFSSPMDNDKYSSFSKGWPQFRYTLEVLENDLNSTLDKISLWRAREKDRGTERPRWTRNDEGKYRSDITKCLNQNNQKIRILEHHRNDIRSLRISLTSRLDSTRNELSFSNAENVRFFTYVTVVFLPLGFATAIFSMGGIPGKSETIGMVVTAIVALSVTVLALNAKYLYEKSSQRVQTWRQKKKPDPKVTPDKKAEPEQAVEPEEKPSQSEGDNMV